MVVEDNYGRNRWISGFAAGEYNEWVLSRLLAGDLQSSGECQAACNHGTTSLSQSGFVVSGEE